MDYRYFISLILIFFTNCLFSQEWVEAVKNDRQSIELDISSIKRNNNIVLFWNKTIYKNQMARDNYVDKIEKYESKSGISFNRKRYNNFDFTVALQRIDCESNKTTLVLIIDYNKDGSVINREDIKEENQFWSPIVPNTLTSGLAEILCTTFTYEANNKYFQLKIEQLEEFIKRNPLAQFKEAR